MDEEEWEIVRIVGKRRRGRGYEYKVCWKETWLLERELGNAQELLRKFEAKHQAQRGGKRGRPARADKGLVIVGYFLFVVGVCMFLKL